MSVYHIWIFIYNYLELKDKLELYLYLQPNLFCEQKLEMNNQAYPFENVI